MSKNTRKIEVVPYNPKWPEIFKIEAKKITVALQNNFTSIHHVGSTSVPNLAAKPKIDIIAEVKNPKESIKQLESIGYEYRGEYNIPLHYGFSKRGDIGINLHVYEDKHPEIALNLAFRDYLRDHPAIKDEYATLKFDLLEKKSSFEKNNSMFTGYNLGKNAFIHTVLKKTGFNQLRFVISTHFNEINSAKEFRQKYRAEKNSAPFDHKDHIHLTLYKGVDIIGYSHIELHPNSETTMHMLILNDENSTKEIKHHFISLIKHWLNEKGYHYKK